MSMDPNKEHTFLCSNQHGSGRVAWFLGKDKQSLLGYCSDKGKDKFLLYSFSLARPPELVLDRKMFRALCEYASSLGLLRRGISFSSRLP